MTGCLPCSGMVRAAFVVKFGALIQTSAVCPARNLRCVGCRFRAVVYADDHFPYAAGRSPVVGVIVSP